MTAFQEQVDRLLRQRLHANNLDDDRNIALVLTPQNAGYCSVTLNNEARTVIKIVGELGDDDELISQQIDRKVISVIKDRGLP